MKRFLLRIMAFIFLPCIFAHAEDNTANSISAEAIPPYLISAHRQVFSTTHHYFNTIFNFLGAGKTLLLPRQTMAAGNEPRQTASDPHIARKIQELISEIEECRSYISDQYYRDLENARFKDEDKEDEDFDEAKRDWGPVANLRSSGYSKHQDKVRKKKDQKEKRLKEARQELRRLQNPETMAAGFAPRTPTLVQEKGPAISDDILAASLREHRLHLKELILQWVRTSSTFTEPRFTPSDRQNRWQFLSVSWPAAPIGKRIVDRNTLNIMDHFVDDLAYIDLLNPGLAEMIFKCVIQVENIRATHMAENVLNSLSTTPGRESPLERRVALAPTAAWELTRQMSHIGYLGNGSRKALESFAAVIWYSEVFRNPSLRSKKQLPMEVFQLITQAFLEAQLPYIYPAKVNELVRLVYAVDDRLRRPLSRPNIPPDGYSPNSTRPLTTAA